MYASIRNFYCNDIPPMIDCDLRLIPFKICILTYTYLFYMPILYTIYIYQINNRM